MFESNIQELESYLNGMAKRTTNMRPVMGMIGEKIVTISKESFEKEQDPISGKEWSPLSKTTLKSKARRGKADNKKLVDSADLKTKSIDYEATNDSLETYASREYAATHFFGDESRNIKQRRYMPFTDSLDLDVKLSNELLEDLGDYILKD